MALVSLASFVTPRCITTWSATFKGRLNSRLPLELNREGHEALMGLCIGHGYRCHPEHALQAALCG